MSANAKPCPCPLCGKTLDHGTHVRKENARPKAGDFGICLDCGAILVYREDLGVRLATQAEKDELGRRQPQDLERMMTVQRRILALAHPRVLGVSYSRDAGPQGVGACYRCGRSMNVLCPGETFSVPRIDICTDCLPRAMKELELPKERGAVVFPPTWAHSRKVKGRTQ